MTQKTHWHKLVAPHMHLAMLAMQAFLTDNEQEYIPLGSVPAALYHNSMTDASKNNTLPQTLFAGSKNRNIEIKQQKLFPVLIHLLGELKFASNIM